MCQIHEEWDLREICRYKLLRYPEEKRSPVYKTFVIRQSKKIQAR
jgi:hypothetical protein